MYKYKYKYKYTYICIIYYKNDFKKPIVHLHSFFFVLIHTIGRITI